MRSAGNPGSFGRIVVLFARMASLEGLSVTLADTIRRVDFSPGDSSKAMQLTEDRLTRTSLRKIESPSFLFVGNLLLGLPDGGNVIELHFKRTRRSFYANLRLSIRKRLLSCRVKFPTLCSVGSNVFPGGVLRREGTLPTGLLTPDCAAAALSASS